MVKSSVLWSIVYLAVSNYPDGGFFPCFFFFLSLFSFCICVVTSSKCSVCGRHSTPSERMSLPPKEVLAYADDMNKDWEEKKGDRKVKGAGDHR